MYRIFIISIWTLTSFIVQGQTEVKEGYVDTIRFKGTCKYMGQTGSIIATTYYCFKVDEVLEGTYEGDTIIFESNVNSKNLMFINQHSKEDEIKDIPIKTLFPDCDVPVSKVYRCSSEPFEIQVTKLVEDLSFLNRGVRVTYHKRWVRD